MTLRFERHTFGKLPGLEFERGGVLWDAVDAEFAAWSIPEVRALVHADGVSGVYRKIDGRLLVIPELGPWMPYWLQAP